MGSSLSEPSVAMTMAGGAAGCCASPETLGAWTQESADPIGAGVSCVCVSVTVCSAAECSIPFHGVAWQWLHLWKEDPAGKLAAGGPHHLLELSDQCY